MKLYSINTGYFKLDGGAMFGVVPKSIWHKINPADENNLCSWALRCLLIEDGKRLTLIDNGIGDKQDEKFFGHYYLHGNDTLDKSLAAHGFSKNDITDVILTHLHFDHCGGSIKRDGDKLVPAFKNAVYWSNARHWKWATEPNDREKASFLKENILPIKDSGQLKFIEADGNSFPENIIAADLFPMTSHIPLPYIMGYDMFPLTTLNEKKSFLMEALQNEYILFFEHDPAIECCNLQMSDRGIRMKDQFLLSAI